MSRIEQTFVNLKTKNQTALVTYFTAGHPTLDVAVDIMHQLVASGSHMIEVGVPFSDPLAEGPVIEAAHQQALKQNVSLMDVLEIIKQFRIKDKITPIILMGYLNPIEVMGYEKFTEAAHDADIDGTIIVDLPPEEGEVFFQKLQQQNIDPILFLSPTTSSERMQHTCKLASGFIYYVALKGITGAKISNIEQLAHDVNSVRENTQVPIGVGFGIKDAQSAKAIAQFADAAIVGTEIVKRIEAQKDNISQMLNTVGDFVKELRQAIDNK